MELRSYWRIIRPPLVVAGRPGAAGAVLHPGHAEALAAEAAGVQRDACASTSASSPSASPASTPIDRYYTMLTSEYLVDDLGEIVRSQVFAEEVSKRLADKGIAVPAGAIGASTQPGKLHRILTVNVSWPEAGAA